MGNDRGKIDIEEITGGVVNFDGAVVVSPKTATKSTYGAGSNNTAVFTFTLTGTNLTNTAAADILDQPVSNES